MIRRELTTTLLLVATIVGCRWPYRCQDKHYLSTADSRNRQQQHETIRTTRIPPLPLEDGTAAVGLDANVEQPAGDLNPSVEQPDKAIALQEALEVALSQPSITRVTRGSVVTASIGTFYDVQISDERLRAALAAFDTRFETELYTNQFRNPPDAFFGPGLAQPEQRDEAAITAGLSKPLSRGGLLSAAYNPSPGYFFEPDSTTSGFNPRYISELQLSYRQPVLRNAGLQVNVAPIQVARLEVEQSAWDFKRSLISTVRSVAVAYWDLYAARVAVEQYKQAIPLLEEIVRIQQESLRANLVIAADVAKARGQLYEYRQDYLRLQSEVVTQELRLRNLLKLPPTGGAGKFLPVTAPTDQRVQTTPNESFLVAMDNRPEIVRRRLNVSIRRLEVLVANNQRKPDLDFTALYRLNGVGENLGNALDQMINANFTDVELGLTLAMPIGLREKTAEAREARYRLVRDRRYLEEAMFSVSHQISEAVQRIEFAYREYEQAKLQLESGDEWVRGARLRYMNPEPDSKGTNWILQYLDDYYRALRFRTDAAIEVAETLNRYNVELVLYEEIKGTLLDFFAIDYMGDPCRQAAALNRVPRPVLGAPIPNSRWTGSSGLPSLRGEPEGMLGGEGTIGTGREELPPPNPDWQQTPTPQGISPEPGSRL
jgi:outer membrane protein TolC